MPRSAQSNLGEEMEGWEEACEAEDGVDDWDPVESLAVNDLHGAVVDAVEAEVEEEYGQEIVGGSGSSRETEIQAEDEVDDADQLQRRSRCRQ